MSNRNSLFHSWIELIFGHKARGEEAVLANNV
jgi:hypothetical protein